MLTTLIICLCIGSITHAGSIATPTSTSAATSNNLSSTDEPPCTLSPPISIIDDELTKISASCITYEEYQKLSGRVARWQLTRTFNELLINEAVAEIGLQELRSVLGFTPAENWTKKREKPSAEELAAAPTLEAYYELKEPFSYYLDDGLFSQRDSPTDIAFLDKRIPTIRKIFRHKFKETLRRYEGKAIDRKTVDDMIEEWRTIRRRVNDAVWDMEDNTLKCDRATDSTSTATSNNLSSTHEPPSTLSPSLFVIDDELNKLSASCITMEEHEELSGRVVRWQLTSLFNNGLIGEAGAMIGLQELRSVLGFTPTENWTKKREEPSEEELAAAPTLEAYYELKEPFSYYLDDGLFSQRDSPTDIAFLDKRIPTIRKIFRHKFEETLRRYEGKAIDRKAVDDMIEEFRTIFSRVKYTVWDLEDNILNCDRVSHIY